MQSRLWYDKPAQTWTQALPLGNGRLGAMVFGGVHEERLSLNEESVWAGRTVDRNNPRSREALGQVRQLLFDGRNQEAALLAQEMMLAVPSRIESYQPLGDLWLRFDAVGKPTGYRRELNLLDGIARVRFQADQADISREIFVSAVDEVLVAHLHGGRQGTLHLDLGLTRQSDADALVTDDGDLLLMGRCNGEGVGFVALLRVLPMGGSIVRLPDRLRIEDADEAVVLLAGATDYRGEDPRKVAQLRIAAAASRPYEDLRQRHIDDHRRLMTRVELNLDQTEALSQATTEEQLSGCRADDADPSCFALNFQYCRYLLMSASRPGSLPSNLQGLWNDKLIAPWNSDYHPNINLQMNYWIAETSNLAECHQPLFDWMGSLVEPGSRTAHVHYGCRGWVLHHVSDIFGCTTPMDGLWGIWPMGAAWLCRHLWEHYEYGRDRQFLATRAWPMMKAAARFILDFLVEAPAGVAGERTLVTCPSHSPENTFQKADGSTATLTHAATMDLQIIHDLFTNCLDAIEAMNDPQEAGFATELRDALGRLAPLQISKRTGALQEWIEDYNEPEPSHRHVSHLYGLFPGRQIGDRTPHLAQAARVTLDRRLAARAQLELEQGGRADSTNAAWSLSWMAAMLARLGAGDAALSLLCKRLSGFTLPNLMVNAHGHPQVGDAVGLAAAMVEMLMQSHDGYINVLPALPQRWRRGAVRGLRARGGFEVDIGWENGALAVMRARSLCGQACRVRYNASRLTVRSKGSPVSTVSRDGCYEFATKVGYSYELVPDRA